MSYHRGLDLVLENSNGLDPIYAPEDGLYWVIDKNSASASQYIQISETEMLIADSYGASYGDIGVLVTPQRVYIFCHMDYTDLSSLDIPTSYLQAKAVKKDEQIGMMGANSNGKIDNMGAHVHFEVYERFNNFTINESERQKIKSRVQNANFLVQDTTIVQEGLDLVTDDFIKKNICWQRIDPLSIIRLENYYLLDSADDLKDADLIPYILNKLKDEVIMGADNTATTGELGMWFAVWPSPITWEGERYEDTYK